MRVYLAKGCTSYEAPLGAASRIGGGGDESNIVLDRDGLVIGAYWAESQGPNTWCRSDTSEATCRALTAGLPVALDRGPGPVARVEGIDHLPHTVRWWFGSGRGRQPVGLGKDRADVLFGVHG